MKRQSERIRVGVIGSTSGTARTYGQSIMRGVELAFDEVTNSGGLLGKEVVFVPVDDKSDAAEAKTAAKKLIEGEKVIAILGEVSSTRTDAAAEVAEKFSIPMIAPAATNPEVTRRRQYIFRVCFTDDFQGYALAQFAVRKFRRAAVLRDDLHDYSKYLTDVFSKEFKPLNGTVAEVLDYSEGDTDFRAQVRAIGQMDVQGLFIPGYYREAGMIADEVHKKGLTHLTLLGADGWHSRELTRIGGSRLDGSYFSDFYDNDQSEDIKTFVRTYKDKWGSIPDSNAGLSYDAAKLLFDAIRRANSTEPTKIREKLADTKDFSGATGKITIDKDHNAIRPAVIKIIRGGQFIYETTIPPRSTA